LIVLASCSNTSKITKINPKISAENKTLYLDLSLNYPVPEKMQNNLKMFSKSKIILNLKIYNSKKKIVFVNNIDRTIIYDRWNNNYVIKDSYSFDEKKFIKFDLVKKNIYTFESIPFYYSNLDDISNPMLLNYDFYLKSIDLVQPFKLIEYYSDFGNIKSVNNMCKFYVEK